MELVARNVQQLQAVLHVLKQQRPAPNVIQDIICQVEHVFFVQVRLPIVQHVHQHPLVPPVPVDIIHPDPPVLCVPVKNVQVAMPHLVLVQLVNQDII